MTTATYPTWSAKWAACREELGSVRAACGAVALYVALRAWTGLMNCFPIGWNLATARILGRVWWLIMRKHRKRAFEHLRASFGPEYSDAALRTIARRSFEHWAQVYLVELVMTPRLVTEYAWKRYLDLDDIAPALREMISNRGVILLTSHFGNFELMGYALARVGLPMTAIMRPLDNPLLTDHLVRSRAAGGLDLLFKRGAMDRAPEILAAGGQLSFIADQDAGRKGVFADFFGRPASWYKSIGLLAMHADVPIIVGHATRTRAGFHYRVSAQRIIQPEEWREQDRPLEWITQTFATAMESAIRDAPEQYLWIHRRWKTQPGAKRKRRKPDADAPVDDAPVDDAHP